MVRRSVKGPAVRAVSPPEKRRQGKVQHRMGPTEAIAESQNPSRVAAEFWADRDALTLRMARRLGEATDEARAEHDEAQVVLRHALELERILGSFHQLTRGGDSFPPEAADLVAHHLMAWLDGEGYEIRKCHAGSDDQPLPYSSHRNALLFDRRRLVTVLADAGMDENLVAFQA